MTKIYKICFAVRLKKTELDVSIC